jgi:CheY-like chemotaxis protein
MISNQQPDTTHHSPLTTHKILVCDDEPHILHAVSFKLSTGGFEIAQASNGREAIAWLESHTPDFIITDYQMPDMNGFELCEFIRSRPETADVPIIMLTAKALEMSEESVKQRFGLEALLMKPFSPRGLLDSVRKVLSSRVVEAAAAW